MNFKKIVDPQVDGKVVEFLGNETTEYVPVEQKYFPGFDVNSQGFFPENENAGLPSAWFIEKPYMTSIVDLSGGYGYKPDPWGGICQKQYLLCRKDKEWEFGLTRAMPFGSFGKPILSLLEQSWCRQDIIPAGQTLYRKNISPNLARIHGQVEFNVLLVDNAVGQSLENILWLKQEEVSEVLGHPACVAAEVIGALALACGGSHPLFVQKKNLEIDQVLFNQKVYELLSRATVIIFEAGKATRDSVWRLMKTPRKTAIGHKDAKFFTIIAMEYIKDGENIAFPAILEERQAYDVAGCRANVGEIHLPLRVFQNKLEVGITPWGGRQGNRGFQAFVLPRRSDSSATQLTEIDSKIVNETRLYTFVQLLTGLADVKIINDPGYQVNFGKPVHENPQQIVTKEIVWFTTDELVMLLEKPEMCDSPSLAMIYWAMANEAELTQQLT